MNRPKRPEGQAIYETNEAEIRKNRIRYWISAVVLSLAFSLFGLKVGGDLKMAAFLFVGAWAIMLLNFWRTVIGLKIYSDRVHLITVSRETVLKRNEIKVRKYPGRMDIIARWGIWPYMIPVSRSNKQAVEMLHGHD